MALERIKLGISSCLLGNKVRYDGGHKRDYFITRTLGRCVEYVPVCPEVELGLGVPREPLRLWFDPDSPRLITADSGKDLTQKMIRWARRRVRELEKENLWGFIFKKGSPSDGIRQVKVYMGDGRISKRGVGIFARAFMEHFPLLPVEDEWGLHDPAIRKDFMERIFLLGRWRSLLSGKRGIEELLDFHEVHKLLILSRTPENLKAMEDLLERRREIPVKETYSRYEALLLDALKPRYRRRKE